MQKIRTYVYVCLCIGGYDVKVHKTIKNKRNYKISITSYYEKI